MIVPGGRGSGPRRREQTTKRRSVHCGKRFPLVEVTLCTILDRLPSIRRVCSQKSGSSGRCAAHGSSPACAAGGIRAPGARFPEKESPSSRTADDSMSSPRRPGTRGWNIIGSYTRIQQTRRPGTRGWNTIESVLQPHGAGGHVRLLHAGGGWAIDDVEMRAERGTLARRRYGWLRMF